MTRFASVRLAPSKLEGLLARVMYWTLVREGGGNRFNNGL